MLNCLRTDMGSTDPMPQFSHIVRQLKKYNLAYLHVTEPRVAGSGDVDAPPGSTIDPLREIWCGEGKDGVFISAGGHTRETAIETAKEKGGLIAFGRLYIPNVSPLVFLSFFCFPGHVSYCTFDPSFLFRMTLRVHIPK